MSNYGTISSILKHKGSQVWTISQTTTVLDALKLMAEKDVGALVVTSGKKPKGIISERDYARKVILKGKASAELLVKDIVSAELITVAPDQTVEECMRLMSSKRIRHLPVLAEDKLIGIISIGDLVNWIISAQTETIIQLESYITGQYPG